MPSVTIEYEYVLKLWPRRVFYVLRCHALTLLIMLVGSCELFNIVHRQQRMNFFKMATVLGCNYCLLYYVGFSFWLFIWLAYFHKMWTAYAWWFRMFFTFLMAWLATPLMWLPQISAQVYEWYYAAAATVILMCIHTGLAMFREKFYGYSAQFFVIYSVRAFVVSSLGIVLSIAWKSSQIDVCVSVFVLSCLTILIILFGRTMGCDEFFENEIEPNENLYMIITNYNFISWYSHLILALCKIRCVMQPYRIEETISVTTPNASIFFENFEEIENFEYTY